MSALLFIYHLGCLPTLLERDPTHLSMELGNGMLVAILDQSERFQMVCKYTHGHEFRSKSKTHTLRNGLTKIRCFKIRFVLHLSTFTRRNVSDLANTFVTQKVRGLNIWVNGNQHRGPERRQEGVL